MRLTQEQRELREQFVGCFGYWREIWNDLLALDSEFFRAYLELARVPWRRRHLEPKLKELVHIALDGAATHLFTPGLRQHIRNALALGATKEEILEVCELAATIGIHSCNLGVPILVDELRRATASRGSTP